MIWSMMIAVGRGRGFPSCPLGTGRHSASQVHLDNVLVGKEVSGRIPLPKQNISCIQWPHFFQEDQAVSEVDSRNTCSLPAPFFASRTNAIECKNDLLLIQSKNLRRRVFKRAQSSCSYILAQLCLIFQGIRATHNIATNWLSDQDTDSEDIWMMAETQSQRVIRTRRWSHCWRREYDSRQIKIVGDCVSGGEERLFTTRSTRLDFLPINTWSTCVSLLGSPFSISCWYDHLTGGRQELRTLSIFESALSTCDRMQNVLLLKY